MKNVTQTKIGLLLFAGSIFSQSPMAEAIDRSQVSSKVLYQAVDQLTEYLNQDLAEVSKHTKKTAVVNYTQSEELPTSIQHYLIKRLEHLANKNNRTPVKFVQCMECLSLQAIAEGDEIFIRKGITDDQQLETTMNKLGIRKYSDIHLAYTGDQLVMQMNVVDKNKLVDWSGEYKTPYKAYDDSQWVMGASAEVGAYLGDDFPAATGARASFGQRLTGLGSAGLTGTIFVENPGFPGVMSLGSFIDVSHNEIFNQYWDFLRLSYQAELGITDFNGNQLIHETFGIKTIIGKHYSVALNTKLHQFISEPTDKSPIANPEGKSLLKNNEVLPMLVSLALGVELL